MAKKETQSVFIYWMNEIIDTMKTGPNHAMRRHVYVIRDSKGIFLFKSSIMQSIVQSIVSKVWFWVLFSVTMRFNIWHWNEEGGVPPIGGLKSVKCHLLSSSKYPIKISCNRNHFVYWLLYELSDGQWWCHRQCRLRVTSEQIGCVCFAIFASFVTMIIIIINDKNNADDETNNQRWLRQGLEHWTLNTEQWK